MTGARGTGPGKPLSQDAPWLRKGQSRGWGGRGEKRRCLLSTCVWDCFSTCMSPPPHPQPEVSREGAGPLTLLAKAQSWAPRRMLLRRRASMALFLAVFSFTAWICSARHCSGVGGGERRCRGPEGQGVGQGLAGFLSWGGSTLGRPKAGWAQECRLHSQGSFLPPTQAHWLHCSTVLMWMAPSGGLCWAAGRVRSQPEMGTSCDSFQTHWPGKQVGPFLSPLALGLTVLSNLLEAPCTAAPLVPSLRSVWGGGH